MFESPKTALQTDRFRQSLLIVPVHNTSVARLPSDSPQEVTLEVTLQYGPIGNLLRKVLTARTKKRFVLEGVGREVYEDIDGKSNFEQLIDRFADRHRLTFLESRALLAQYLQRLTKAGLVVATLPTPTKA